MVAIGLQTAGPAIEALGSLFKLTQVFLWDDGSAVTQHRSPSRPQHIRFSYDEDDGGDGGDGDMSSNITSTNAENSPLEEDTELARQMDALGLPLSFSTNKEKRNGTLKGRTRAARMRRLDDHKNGAVEVFRVNEGEIASPSNFNDINSLCSMQVIRRSKSSYSTIAMDASDSSSLPDGEDLGGLLASTSCPDFEVQNTDGNPFDSDVGTSLTSYLTDDGARHIETDSIEKVLGCECLEGPTAVYHDGEAEKSYIEIDAQPSQVPDSAAPSQHTQSSDLDETGNYHCNAQLGVWRAFWDSCYKRSYFYNIETQESTWYPPLGMEHLTSSDSGNEPNEMIVDKSEELESGSDGRFSCQTSNELVVGTELTGDNFECHLPLPTVSCIFDNNHDLENVQNICSDDVALYSPADSDEQNSRSLRINPETILEVEMNDDINLDLPSAVGLLISEDEPVTAKRKKKAKTKKTQRKLSSENEELQLQTIWEECSANIKKYWCQRYRLFSRFDDGIKMDEEGWFSVTPEPIARHQASRCGSGIIVDCFTGVGGNAIQFAERSMHVTAVDIDPKKIEYAQHNAAIYGVDDRIDFINGDCFLLATKLKADTVFLSPPWGGPDYTRVKTYDIDMLKPHNGHFLFHTARQMASRIVMFLPRNVNIDQLAELSLSANPPWSLEVERNFLNGKLKAITAYFSITSKN